MKMRYWDNFSGHYKVPADYAEQASLPEEKFQQYPESFSTLDERNDAIAEARKKQALKTPCD